MAGGDIYDPSKWYTPDKNPILKAAVRRVLAASHGHIAVSTDLARRAREIYGFEGPIDVISLGAPAPKFTPAPRAELGLEPGIIYLATVGRLVRRKNLSSLVTALSRLGRALRGGRRVLVERGRVLRIGRVRPEDRHEAVG